MLKYLQHIAGNNEAKIFAFFCSLCACDFAENQGNGGKLARMVSGEVMSVLCMQLSGELLEKSLFLLHIIVDSFENRK